MAKLSIEDARERFQEIKKQVDKLNEEAEELLAMHPNEDAPEGYGRCEWNRFACACNSYKSGGAPGMCARLYCGHPASYHAF